MQGINTIIWDWNGTLFNDIDICIESINLLLHERGIDQIDKKRYLEVFDFPVRDYYQRIGFNFEKEAFEIPAMQFIDLYFARIDKAVLHADASTVLQYFSNKHFTQLVLSAAEQQKLETMLRKFNIHRYFKKVCGLEHDYATSKVDLGINMLSELGIKPSGVCLIGDTVHDFEVAQLLGCACVLVANGHHSVERLKQTGAVVVNKLDGVMQLIR